MNDVPTNRIIAPAPTLARLSFCETDPSALTEWVIALPMANTADAASRIRQATYEIARLNVDPERRMELLEQVRPILHYLCARLDRNAASSTSQSDAIARLAQGLQTDLCAGYKSVVAAALDQNPGDHPARFQDDDLLPMAIHRALSDLSRTLLRTLQFYVEPADRLWLELNQLYLIAERLELEGRKLEDAENHASPVTTPMSAYLRSVLLACSKPNQMRYRQLAEVFNYLETWSTYVSLERDATSALFAVDLASDDGPIYKRLMRDAVEPRGIRTDALVFEIECYLRGAACSIRVPEGASEGQLRHLAAAWGMMRPRSHRRTTASGLVKACVGLRDAHYFLSGGTEFADLLDDPEALAQQEVNPFLADRAHRRDPKQTAVKDVWDDAFDVTRRIPENPHIADPNRILRDGRERDPAAARESPPDSAGSHQIYDTTAIDTSPGGYQIRWNDPLPPHLQTGEVLAMREAADSRWSVAVVRWIRQDQQGTAMGIELLSPRAIPVAARVIQKLGGPTTYARALMLPELKPIGQPATLITPRVPFQAGQKVHVQKQGVRSTAQLTKCVLRTESVSRFTYRMLSGYLENAHVTLKMSGQ